MGKYPNKRDPTVIMGTKAKVVVKAKLAAI
jgi:hypothetical protein